MIRSPLLIAAIALAATACTRGDDRIAQYPAPAAQPGYQAAAPVYRPAPYEPVRAAPQVPAPRVYSAPVRSYPAPTVARAYPQPLPAAPAPARIVADAPQAAPAPRLAPVPARRTLVNPRVVETPQPVVQVAAAPAAPQSVAVPAEKSEALPLPRRKPRYDPLQTVQVAAAAQSGSSSLSIPAATYAVTDNGQSVPPTIEYNIPHLPQEEPLWCWAAAAQQAIGWVNNGRAPAQCAIVALAHGISPQECCADREGVCAKTGEIPAIAALVRRFGGQAAETASVPRDPKEIYRILKSGGTLLIRLRPAPHDAAVGIRHMIVVRGIEWLRLPNGQLTATLHYNDPLGAGQRSVDFDEISGFFEQALIVRRNT